MSQKRERRRGRRRQRQTKETADAPIVQPRNPFPTYNLVDEERLDILHRASMQILSEIGIAFLEEEAQTILRQHGVTVRDGVAFFDPALVEEYVAKAPGQFTQLARSPEHNVVIGGNYVCFAPVYGPPFVYSQERGRREATLVDFHNFVKLAYLSPYIHHSGGTIVEPTDIPVATRHLDMIYGHIKYNNKPFMGGVMSGQHAADSVTMAEILFGAEAIRQNPALLSLINVSSPRRFDDRMLEALIVYARARQAVIITPFILSGAMAPVSVAGTVAQMNAEALAGIAFTQMVNSGTPVVYGSFQSTTDLHTGAPVFGSPESQQALYLSAQLARRYGLPFRSGGMFTGSKIADAQAGYESVMAMLPAVMGQVNFVLHAAGWLEGGLSAGYEKFVLDCELLGMFHQYLKGLDLSTEGLAMESIRIVEPGGHHLGTPHTMRHFRTAFYNGDLFDSNSAEQWQTEGSLTATQRANPKYQRLLREYQPPPLDPATEEALLAFITHRKLKYEV
jgi:trimethylamine--corrinoid protein Co-methyltransferase